MRDSLTFILNGERQSVADIQPTMTLLSYLRRLKRLTGSKEGCAEGDCGACTVVVGELDPLTDLVRYRAVNSCIQLMPMLEGTSVVTVDHLAGPNGELHPVQQGLVDHHGSQCGFCTPGFVMTLYAAYLEGQQLDTKAANDLLAGNLCRCTGYGPIIKAAVAMFDTPTPSWDEARRAAHADQLRAIAHDETVMSSTSQGTVIMPATLDALAGALQSHPEATIVAGATDVGLWVTKQHRALPVIVTLGRIKALQAIEKKAAALRIGAGATWSQALEAISQHYPDFGELVRRFGSPLVRNSGTVGGNIANGSPIGDGAPALIALSASLILRKGAVQRSMPLDAFFLAYGKQDRQHGEFVEAIEVPLLDDPGRLRCYKISKRFDQDISAVCGCFNITVAAGNVTAARICFGGMAGTPKRASHVEAALTGKPWTMATVEQALLAFDQDYTPLTDVRGSAAYRQQTAKNLLIKYFLESQPAPPPTRLVGREAAFA